jgi:DNA-binding MarR family transcriptional regulator
VTSAPKTEDDQSELSAHRVERLRRGLLPLVAQSFFYTRRSFDEAMRAHGITGSQAGVLSRIYDEPGISGAGLSRQMLTTPQAVQLMLATLERKGLISREPDPTQGRVVGSRLTKLGREVFLACLADAAEADKKLSASLTAEEREALIELLEKYLRGNLPAAAQSKGRASSSSAAG